uniref:Aminopeptidase 2, mitochondrial n=1 Tax=Aegilops tauschii TaxID=37682 RepID=M8AI14_AEGTA
MTIALKKYIQKYAYSNAKTEDLWVVLEEETGEPFKDFMSTWTKQPGFPIINIKHKGKGIQVEQITITVYHVSIDATPNLVADIKKLVTKILLPPTLKLGWDPKDGEGDLIAAYLSVMQTVCSSNRFKYDSLRQLYKDFGDEEEKLHVLGTLSSCLDKDIVLESLNLIFTNEIISKWRSIIFLPNEFAN